MSLLDYFSEISVLILNTVAYEYFFVFFIIGYISKTKGAGVLKFCCRKGGCCVEKLQFTVFVVLLEYAF